MNRTDFSTYKFRCSALGQLMTNARGKTETLSATTKTYLHQLHAEEVFNKRTEIQSKYLDKGIQVEEHSITLYSNVVGQPFYKNKERKTDEWITGEPDNAKGMIRDIKSSWSLKTFPMHDEKIPSKAYYWQLMGYMSLWGFDKSELIYCLVDTPELLIEDEKRRTCWKLGFIDLPDEMAEEIDQNMRFQNIPEQLRCKVFNLDFDAEAIEALHSRIAECRTYLNKLSDSMADKLEIQLTEK